MPQFDPRATLLHCDRKTRFLSGFVAGKDQARFYEYALGSAREARGWYYQGRYPLSESVATHRIQLLTQIIHLLLTIIPAQRGHKLKEGTPPYDVPVSDPSAEVPTP